MTLQDNRRGRTRSILIIIIIASLACYCLGFLVWKVGDQFNQPDPHSTITQTPTQTMTNTLVTYQPTDSYYSICNSQFNGYTNLDTDIYIHSF